MNAAAWARASLPPSHTAATSPALSKYRPGNKRCCASVVHSRRRATPHQRESPESSPCPEPSATSRHTLSPCARPGPSSRHSLAVPFRQELFRNYRPASSHSLTAQRRMQCQPVMPAPQSWNTRQLHRKSDSTSRQKVALLLLTSPTLFQTGRTRISSASIGECGECGVALPGTRSLRIRPRHSDMYSRKTPWLSRSKPRIDAQHLARWRLQAHRGGCLFLVTTGTYERRSCMAKVRHVE